VTLEYILLLFFAGLIPLAYAAFFLGRRKAETDLERGYRLNSPPSFYGWYVIVWMFLPAIAVSAVFAVLHMAGILSVPAPVVLVGFLALIAAGGGVALRHVKASLRARKIVEDVIRWLLFIATCISIFTTVGIVLSVVFEAVKFFNMVSVWEFLTGTTWSPGSAFLEGAGRGGEQSSKAEFGSVPIFAGTFMITFIAMCVALPVGLFSAIFMSEYAGRNLRGVAKPALEVLAGIPTVVYGFFAAITVSPFIVSIAESLGLEAAYTNALSPGIVMGIMIIPFISSLSDDVISSIPQSLREGSFALGTTRSETIKNVVLPAAFPGIVSAFLLGVSRALGETMIVVMAAGLRPNLTWNPLEGMTTVTVRIVDALTGDLAFDSAETLSAFALGLTLLVVTLMLNIVSSIVIRRFKQQYEM
jgi:phosphate transport system permease protein